MSDADQAVAQVTLSRAVATHVGGTLAQMRQLINDCLDTDNVVRFELEQLAQLCGEAIERVEELGTFGGSQVLVRKPREITGWLAENRPRLSAALGTDARLRIDSAIEAQVSLDSEQLLRALVGLLQNSAQAGASEVAVNIAPAAGEAFGQQDTLVVIRVSDNGCGFPEALQSHAHLPFVSGGNRRGMGLAIAFGILGQHGGGLQISPKATGPGTVVSCFLPIADTRSHAPSPVHQTQSARLIIVDDEPMTGRAAVRVLKSLGYQIRHFDSPIGALDELAETGEPIDLLISDVMMPGIDGVELADRLRARNPGLRVVFTSGYPQEMIDRIPKGAHFVEKPFAGDELVAAIKRALA